MKEEFHNSDKMFPAVVTMENINNVGKTDMIKSYEKFLETRLNPTILKTLQDLYKNANQLDLYTKLTDEYIKVYPNFNPLRKDKLDILFADFQNPEIEKEIDNCLANFPYSYSTLALKADYLAKTDRKEEAIEYAKKSLSHYSANQTMQNLIRDLENKENDLQKVGLQNIENYVEENRNTNTKGSRGVTILYDEYIAEALPEGGYKSRTTFLYEITAEKGINELKEYYLDGGENIIKSEIIKKNGKIVPGEKSYSQVVFTNLEIGDVVLIQTEGKSNQVGRFYKDFYFYSYFASVYPSLKSVLTVITPKDISYNYKTNNGEIPFTEKIENEKRYRTWKAINIPELISTESYSKNYYDRATSVTVSSIKSWKEIANWYSDLIRKNLVFDKTTEKAYQEIFPNGVSSLNEYQKAFKIYEYIEKNINYSSVDFRQSGYIPQKPSKTLVSKLGDCKDLSTLFVIFAQKAGLEANLVLVRTSDLDENSLILPNVNFNHCIVQVNLDGKTTYLEMTDKFLPFNSVSKNIYHAKALVIHTDNEKNENAQLFEIPDTNNEKMLYKTLTEAQYNGDQIKFNTNQSVQGESKSFFNDFFSGEKTDEEMKNYFEEDFGSRLNELLRVKTVTLVAGKDITNQPLTYEIEYEANENLQSLGDLMILKIPFITKPFTKDIISLENRNSDIKYIYYENQNQYDEEITLNIPENAMFVEIPKNKNYKYKDFNYAISYKLIKPNQLIVHRKADTSWKNISKEEYVNFRNFVEKILNAENQVLGYKKTKK